MCADCSGDVFSRPLRIRIAVIVDGAASNGSSQRFSLAISGTDFIAPNPGERPTLPRREHLLSACGTTVMWQHEAAWAVTTASEPRPGWRVRGRKRVCRPGDAAGYRVCSVHNSWLQKSPGRILGQISGNSVNISKAFFHMIIWKFESSQVSQPVRRLEILPSANQKMPANGGPLRIGSRSPDSKFGRGRPEIADSLRPIFEIFPFSGDCGRRTSSIALRGRCGSLLVEQVPLSAKIGRGFEFEGAISSPPRWGRFFDTRD
jgi:hypothetical protein